MGKMITLSAADGHSFSAYEAGAPDAERCLVVAQEIFGVNHHMRAVSDALAQAGFRVIAPALFDRAQAGVELDYSQTSIQEGLKLRAAVPAEGTLTDLVACADALGGTKVGIIGFCWGGTLAWDAACRTQRFAAAVGWYGGGIAAHRNETPTCPVQLHFGDQDAAIPHLDIQAIRDSHPEIEIFVYDDAGHGFGCSERSSYNADAAELAQARSLEFFRKTL